MRVAPAQEHGQGRSVGGKSNPKAHLTYVIGAVMNRGYVLPARKKTTVLQVVSLARGFDKMDVRVTAAIIRRSGNGSALNIRIHLNKVREGKAPNIELVEDEILFLPSGKNAEPYPCQQPT